MHQITDHFVQSLSNGCQAIQDALSQNSIITGVAAAAIAGFGGGYMLFALGASAQNAIIGGAVFAKVTSLVYIIPYIFSN
jgi:hypothetical protein